MSERPSCPYCACYVPVRISVTEEIDELLKSNEAKHYMKQIDTAAGRLRRFITQNLKRGDSDAVPTDNRSS